jgi:DNA-binding MarR family transcriptional regulator
MDIANERIAVMRLDAALSRFSILSSDMSVTAIRVFLAVAKDQGIAQRDIVDQTGLSAARVSAELARLTGHRVGRILSRGPDAIKAMVELRADDKDRRVKQVWLTPEGRSFVASLVPSLNLVTRRG